jgi:hypothetical protein
MSNAGRVAFVAVLVAGSATVANADVVFSDNFNSYAFEGNWQPQALWTVPTGGVDLIGETTTINGWDLFPGNGGYVDLDGSGGGAGTLETIQSFGPGTYTLTFDLGGNDRGDVAKTTTIMLGDWSTSLTLDSSSPYTLYTYTVVTTGGQLSFADDDAGNGAIGNVLDNVSLSSATPATQSIADPAPELSTWGMILLGFSGLGFAAFRRTAKAKSRRLADF